MIQNVVNWLETFFGFPVPESYLAFVKRGNYGETERLYYIVDIEEKNAIEISQWFRDDQIPRVYRNCIDEGMIEPYHLPVFDSCGCTVVINCDPKSGEYGMLFSRTPAGYYDEELKRNVYSELDFVSNGFAELIENLKTEEELEELGL